MTFSGDLNTLSGSLRMRRNSRKGASNGQDWRIVFLCKRGAVTYQSGQGYAINGIDRAGAADYTDRIRNCYYLNGTGMGSAAVAGMAEAELGGRRSGFQH